MLFRILVKLFEDLQVSGKDKYLELEKYQVERGN